MKNLYITLYAFHLCHTLTDAPGQVTEDASLLWENLTQLGNNVLKFPLLKNLPAKLNCYQQGKYHPQRQLGRQGYYWLTDSGSLDLGSLPSAGGFKIQGNLQPFRLNDTYIADLTLSPDSPHTEIEVSQLQYFNSQGCLLPSSIQASLGQTLWLYAEVEKNDQECKALATACAIALLEKTPLDPVLVHQGKLFGSLIFEYEATDPEEPQNPTKQCHILVSLNNNNAPTPQLAKQAYEDLLNLLCSWHKINYVYYQSRISYQDARQQYSELENQGQNLTQLPEDLQERLTLLKQSLTEVSTKFFKYESQLRDLQAHRTAIETNVSNYQRCLSQLPNQSDDDLGFWEDFLTIDCDKFQKQIQTDLNYLNPGRELFQQLIATIRGIVEIEQAQSDRALAKALREKEEGAEEREKRIGRLIALVGTGLTVTGISSQSPGKPVESLIALDCPKDGFTPCLGYSGLFMLFHIGVGAIAAWILWVIIRKRKTDN